MFEVKKLLDLNITRIALIVILLVLVDFSIIIHENQSLREPAQIRLITQKVDSIQALRRLIKVSKGFKVVFLGDSAVWSSSVKPSQTIPFYLEQQLRKKFPNKEIVVFNYAFKGYGISENYFMLNTLRDLGVDLLIYDVNPNWFNRKQAIDHLNAIKVNRQVFRDSRVAQLGLNLSGYKENLWKTKVYDFLADNWALYRNRSNIAVLFEIDFLLEKAVDYELTAHVPKYFQNRLVKIQDIRRPWYDKNFDQILADSPQIGGFNLNPTNNQLGFYYLLMDLLKEEHITPIFYVTPTNYQLFEAYDKFNHIMWNDNLAKLKSLSRPQENNFLNFSYAVPGKYFTDGIHMLAPGNKLIAQKLTEEIIKRGLIDD